jgi:hypothetical protein
MFFFLFFRKKIVHTLRIGRVEVSTYGIHASSPSLLLVQLFVGFGDFISVFSYIFMFMLLLFLNRCSNRVEGYFEHHASICIHCFRDSGKIKGSRSGHAPARTLSNHLEWRLLLLVFIPRIHMTVLFI